MRLHNLAATVLLFSSVAYSAADWPTYGGSITRQGVSAEQVGPGIKKAWVHRSEHTPYPAWPSSAGVNIATGQLLENSMTYDRAFHPVACDGSVFYGSSSDCTVYCLDADTGRLKWKYITGGPVRLPPAVFEGRVYTGSDDGFVYCLDAGTGKLVWKYRGGPAESERTPMLIGNGRMISRWPVRCGIVVDRGQVYFTAGLFPKEGVYLHSVNASDGTAIWTTPVKVSAQGHMLASAERLFITTGRNTPVSAFSRKDGKQLGAYGETKSWGRRLTGGSTALLVDDMLISGPSEGRQAHGYGVDSPRNTLITVNAMGIVADTEALYVAAPVYGPDNGFEIKRLDRKLFNHNRKMDSETSRIKGEIKSVKARREQLKKELEKFKTEGGPDVDASQRVTGLESVQQKLKELSKALDSSSSSKKDPWLWRTESKRPYAMLRSAEILFVGYEDSVEGYSLSDGSRLWNTSVDGRVYGLAIYNGSLLVSTDKGRIYMFAKKAAVKKNDIIAPVPDAAQNVPSAGGFVSFLKAATGIREKGFCLVTGVLDGRLVRAVAEETEHHVIAVTDPARVGSLRQKFSDLGIYGTRVSVHGKTGDCPFPPYFADLVLNESALVTGNAPEDLDTLFSCLRPDGGVIALAVELEKNQKGALKGLPVLPGIEWRFKSAKGLQTACAERPALPGAGKWTHAYSNPGGTACSGDKLVNDKMDLQWFGRPGPSEMVDRHYRNVPPLYSGGVIFVPGDNVIYGVNAYNGTVLWKKKLENTRRTGAFLDAGSMVVSGSELYVAAGPVCLAIDAASGKKTGEYHLPGAKNEKEMDWGFVGDAGDIIIGSGCTRGSSHSVLSKEASRELWGLGMPVVISMNLFATGKKDLQSKWVYSRGRILNTTLVFDSEAIYFIEVPGRDGPGRMKMSELLKPGAELVALSLSDGKEKFRVQLQADPFSEPSYLQAAGGRLVFSGAKPEDGALRYTCVVFDSATGKQVWSQSHVTFHRKAGDGHGQQNRHPVIAGNTVYSWPYAYSLDNGNKVESWEMDRRGHGCGGVSGSAEYLFWRGGNPWMIKGVPGARAQRLTEITRPGCWINIIPAGGMILIPESSSGCTCAYAIQTSLAFGPRRRWDGRKKAQKMPLDELGAGK